MARSVERLAKALRVAGVLDDSCRPLLEVARVLATAVDRGHEEGDTWATTAATRELRAALDQLSARIPSADAFESLLHELSAPVRHAANA